MAYDLDAQALHPQARARLFRLSLNEREKITAVFWPGRKLATWCRFALVDVGLSRKSNRLFGDGRGNSTVFYKREWAEYLPILDPSCGGGSIVLQPEFCQEKSRFVLVLLSRPPNHHPCVIQSSNLLPALFRFLFRCVAAAVRLVRTTHASQTFPGFRHLNQNGK